MLQVIDVSLNFGSRKLFSEVNLKFTKGNCYGVIGANGAGKSTFLKLLSGELEPSKGECVMGKNERMSVLQQNQNAYDRETVLRTVMLGHKRLMDIADEKEELYQKENFSEADGIRAAELEQEYADLNGWNAESDAATLLSDIGVDSKLFEKRMAEVEPKVKVKVLLAQALFGNPDILLLDEPTNNLDIKTIAWLEEFLLNFENTIITVSHNRHFLNKVCTHICDVDFGKISIFVGNYDFWYETSQLILRQMKETNKKLETRAQELKDFIARFSANASKSKQATSRKKELEKITLEDIKPSSRQYPYIDFKFEQQIGNDVLVVEKLTKKDFFENLNFTIDKGDKVAFLSDNVKAVSALFDIISGADKDYTGVVKVGKTIKISYLPKNYDELFSSNMILTEWLSQYSKEKDGVYLRSWLGRMLFSGEEALKSVKVLSGGEKVRCMLSRAMLTQGNLLILDEPTNHLDLESITALNKGMTNYQGVLLFASSDQTILSTVANRIIRIGGKGKEYDKYITYDEYLETLK
ncbi:MAG: ATP-binding cassette domain-containing protein [Christensenellaceae bacterium]|jgi:ATPase subunit of ABC transporter with duplicated ATPase domains|nr:ATP-binding cassette domain-containing protein [Christensenellaceae bacterium]